MNFKTISMKAYLKILVACATAILLFNLNSCDRPGGSVQGNETKTYPIPELNSYVCYRTTSPIKIDGVPDEESWNEVPWTNYFVDIEGSAKPLPAYGTHAKLLWDDNCLYIAAELEETHIWARLKQRDTAVFYDNDFEVFIDPDQDTHNYYELEVNALGTAWDLLLIKPYRDGGPPVDGWDIAGLQVGTYINGTLNNPSDTDSGWTVEMALPLSALRECNKAGALPVAGDQWKINFSRVEWRMAVENGIYKKEINSETGKPFPENNWVWSPQGKINMHIPEMWGYLQFSSIEAGSATESFVSDSALNEKWALRQIYYAENEYFKKNKTYSSSFKEIGLSLKYLPSNLPAPVINSTRTTFESNFPDNGQSQGWTIYNDGRIVYLH